MIPDAADRQDDGVVIDLLGQDAAGLVERFGESAAPEAIRRSVSVRARPTRTIPRLAKAG